ncbi:molecular chaperone [Bordetella tumulicola]
MMRGRIAIVGLALCLFTARAAGVTLQVSPVTIEMAQGQNGAALTLTNPGDTPVYGQVRVFEWDQHNGEDTLAPTERLVASPPLIQVTPGGDQLVRLVRTPGDKPAVEQAYRIVIDEIPHEQTMPRSGVLIRMRYSIPVFVDNGLSAQDSPVLAWTLLREGGDWTLRVENRGRQRARINTVWIVDTRGRRYDIQEGLLGYALPGRYKIWPLDIPANATFGAKTVIHATINARPAQANIMISPGNGKAGRTAGGEP